jgi:diaminopimelate decarboxylase
VSAAFPRIDDRLHAEAVPIENIVEEIDTPVFVYSATELAARYDALDAALSAVPHSICYSIKGNMNLAVVRTLISRGCGVDVTSGGELFCALRAGGDPSQFVYSGVGKTDAEIDQALDAGIRMFNVESRAELRVIDARAAQRGVVAPVSFRVNPDVDPQTHPYIATGLRSSKFGIPIGEAVDAYAEAKALEHVQVVGVDCHIGSQLVDLQPIVDALQRIRSLVVELRDAGHTIELLDVGGGLGITYADERVASATDYGNAIAASVGDLGCHVILEPGRWITGNAGILVTRVLYNRGTASGGLPGGRRGGSRLRVRRLHRPGARASESRAR